MARPGKSGYNKIVANTDWEAVSTMAKRCVLLDAKVKDVQSQVKTLQRERDSWKTNYNNLWDEVKDYIRAIRAIPNKLRTFMAEQKLEKSQAREETK